MQEKFDLTIIIPTCNRPDLFKECLSSVLTQNILPDHIIIVDQSDSDGISSLCNNYPFITYEHLNIKNKSIAVNHAIEECTSRYIAIVDDDCLLSRNWIEVSKITFNREI